MKRERESLDRRGWLKATAGGIAGIGIAGFGVAGLAGTSVRAAIAAERRALAVGASGADMKRLVLDRTRLLPPPTPSSVLGPYYLPGMPIRSDIRAGQTAGLPVRLYYRVIDAVSSQPISNASVDIWHANACGIYSGFAAQGTAGQNYLRGVQVTDSSGWCLFYSVFPGWYVGRTAHVHAIVRRTPASSTSLTTQFFFGNLWDLPTVAVNPTVYQYVAPYATCGAPQTVNATDPIYNAQLVHTSALPLDGTFGLWAGMIVAI